MPLSEVLQNFLALTQDAVGICFQRHLESTPHWVFASPAFKRYFDTTEDILGQPVCGNPAWDAVAEQNPAEVPVRLRDGSTSWFKIGLFAVDEPDGRYICATFRDITHQRQTNDDLTQRLQDCQAQLASTQRALQDISDRHQRMKTALDAYPTSFAIFDKDLKLVLFNKAYEESMASEAGWIRLGMHWEDIVSDAMSCDLFPLHSKEEEAFLQELESPDEADVHSTDWEFTGDRHLRILQCKTDKGDRVVIRLDITELVRQKRSVEHAQARVLAAINAYPAPFCIYDAELRIAVWNDSYTELLTDDPSEIYEGMRIEDVLRLGLRNRSFPAAAEDEEGWIRDMIQAVETVQPIRDEQLSLDRHYRTLRSRSVNGDIVVLRLDTTELVRQQDALELTQSRLLSAIRAFPDPFAIYDGESRLQFWNPAFAECLTNKHDQIQVGMSPIDIFRIAVGEGRIPAAKGREEEWLNSFVDQNRQHYHLEEIEFAGDQHFRNIRSFSDNGEMVVLRLNITESVRQRRALEEYAERLKSANEEITYKAFHDELTGLGNRRYLSEKFKELCALRKEHGGELAALHLDLDRFKQINDTMGHAAGDYVLLEVAQLIRTHVRPGDVMARIGGDEFVILLWLPEDSDRPQELAETLVSEFSKPIDFHGRQCRSGVSIGIAHTRLSDETNLLINSDVALYKAKRSGRGRVGVFDSSDIDEMRRTKVLADDIIRGLEAKEFCPHYQPQIDVSTGQIVGVEALARWHHPEKGTLPPGYFLSVASDLDVVADIDRMIFSKALNECQDAFASDVSDLPSLSFNVSAARLQFDQINEIGELASTYSGQVSLELLETIFLEEESDEFLMRLDQLREMGISIEVDDFGSGRASVVALQRISPDHLKIDRRLIAPMSDGNNATRLVQSIVEIGHALDISVIAEGVETAEQARILARLGVQRLQGFYFSEPLALPDLLEFMNQNALLVRTGTG
ncbi:MAG: EAL domain-containing protein [Pseudomonadota bacterium]